MYTKGSSLPLSEAGVLISLQLDSKREPHLSFNTEQPLCPPSPNFIALALNYTSSPPPAGTWEEPLCISHQLLALDLLHHKQPI